MRLIRLQRIKRNGAGSAASAPALLAILIAAAALLLMLPMIGCGSSADDGNGSEGQEAAEPPIDANLPAINLIAPDTSGGGEVPTFEWEPVDGAARYRLVAVDGSGSVLWAWNGAETKVNLGGLPGERPEGVGGPVISEGSSWSVVALDESGKALATSSIRSVSP